MTPPASSDPTLPEALRALAADLERELDGPGPEPVRFDRQARAAYSRDASNYRRTPLGVVQPRDPGEVEAALRVCHRHGAAVLPRGAGTSLAGQAVNSAVVLDLSRHLTRVLEIDPEARTARVQPGVVLDTLQEAARRHGLRFGPDPSTHAFCTLGGMLGNNACGVHSLKTGRTSDNVVSLGVLTARGEALELGRLEPDQLEACIARGGTEGELLERLARLGRRVAPAVARRFPDIPRRVSGFNLDEILPGGTFHPGRLLVGTEGTCATVLEATVELVPRPRETALLILSWPTLEAAASAVPTVLEAGGEALLGLEGVDRHLIENPHIQHSLAGALELFPAGEGCLLAELAGFGEGGAAAAGERLRNALAGRGGSSPTGARLLTGQRTQELAWRVREAGVGTTARHPRLGDTAPGWEDAAVAPERLGSYVRDLRGLLDRFGYAAALYGHFGDGCLHARIGFDLESGDGVARYRDFVEEAADLVVGHGGSLSGEHGDGQARGELLPRMFGQELVAAFREVKAIFDPEGRMNPGKVVDPRPLDQDLAPSPVEPPRTRFGYPEDDGSFARAAGRCVGVGKCRRLSGGVMCPSYRVTKAEEHTTRGRARLLQEMLAGDLGRTPGTFPAGTLSSSLGRVPPEVLDALDLCLSCKGCKGDCPVSVDMATYKAEILARHHRFRPRPRSAYALGWIFRWAPLAARVPGLVNALAASKVGGAALRRLAGIDPDRRLPRFADQTFRRWFARRPEPEAWESRQPRPGRTVLLWPDTFTDHFEPQVGRAAVEVLEAAGFEVRLPRTRLCCGRPLYDFGFLSLARRKLRRIVDRLIPEIAAGVPVVGLEPSCVATFRDELPSLLPDHPASRDLSGNVHLLGEFLAREAPELELPGPGFGEPGGPGARALLHGHCHQKAVLGGMEADRGWLERLGWQVEEPEPGCCGMAGAFGFERDHADLSRACGELALLPAVRKMDPGTLLVADGFSCRQQIRQETGREPRHLAQVLERALSA